MRSRLSPSLAVVGCMGGASHNYEIFNPIVGFYPVDVVNNLGLVEYLSSKNFLHLKDMLPAILTNPNTDKPVTVSALGNPSFPCVMVFLSPIYTRIRAIAVAVSAATRDYKAFLSASFARFFMVNGPDRIDPLPLVCAPCPHEDPPRPSPYSFGIPFPAFRNVGYPHSANYTLCGDKNQPNKRRYEHGAVEC